MARILRPDQTRLRKSKVYVLMIYTLDNAGISLDKKRSVNVFRKLKITDYQFLLCICSLSDI